MARSTLQGILTIGILGAATLYGLPAHANHGNIAVPITGGSFVVQGTGAGSTYTQLPQFITPIGTTAIQLNAAGAPNFQSGISLPANTPTPIGVNFFVTTGAAVPLTDGRTLQAAANGSVALQVLATASSAFTTSFSTVPNGTTVSAAIKAGAFYASPSYFSSFPTPQTQLPITGGTFKITFSPNTAKFPTITFNSILTPSERQISLLPLRVSQLMLDCSLEILIGKLQSQVWSTELSL